MAGLFGSAVSSLSTPSPVGGAPSGTPTSPVRGAAADSGRDVGGDPNSLIREAASDLAEYQRLTAEGKLGEAGRKLEQLKNTLDELNKRRR
jgi:hypothetical protein